MKVLLARADGALGRPLTHQLIAHDHLVFGLTAPPRAPAGSPPWVRRR